MERHNENGMKVAEFLEKHPKVEKVFYPGLKSHPQHDLAKRQSKGFSGLVPFRVKGGLKEVRIFTSRIKVFTLAGSLGNVESLVDVTRFRPLWRSGAPLLLSTPQLSSWIDERCGLTPSKQLLQLHSFFKLHT
ncbi:cystathionine gamma-lyase [Trichonephila clavipes]|nr:cystathionine gamma-lyase [Trichonephila clavipes]